jgi:uncharacterized protein
MSENGTPLSAVNGRSGEAEGVRTPERKGDWIQTYCGVEFYPFDPRPEDIQIVDIAHALSMQCRYAGHVREFYSVAEHSVRVAELLPRELQLWGLLHDASEAYLVDLPRPIKRHSEIGRLYQAAEANLMSAICARFGLDQTEPEAVGRADKAMLCHEARALLPDNKWHVKWSHYLTGDESPIDPTWSPEYAKQRFLALFEDLELGIA